MNVEALQIIELDAVRAPAPMVDHYIQLVRNSLAECAAALLLKLENLASNQQRPCTRAVRTSALGGCQSIRTPFGTPLSRDLVGRWAGTRLNALG